MATGKTVTGYDVDGNPTYTSGASSFLGSPGGAAIINGIGGAASAYGAAKSADASRQQSGNQFAASMYDKQSNEDRTNAQNALTPLGESQNFANQQRLRAAIAGQMGNLTGLGGRPSLIQYDPSMIQKNWGDQATMESLAQHAKQLSAINPNAAKENFSNYGIDPTLAHSAQGNIDTYQGNQLKNQTDQRALIQRAIDNDVNGSKQADAGSGFWHKLAKYAGPIAGAAFAPFTGGASLALGSALGAWGSGGSGGDIAAAGAGAYVGNALNNYNKSKTTG